MSFQKEIINIELKKKNFSYYTIYKICLENLFELFYYILKEPFSNFWWESFTLFLEYFQLLIYITDEKVSIHNNIYKQFFPIWNNLDNLKNQKLINALYNNKRPSIILNEKNLYEINRANDEDIAIANSVFGEFDGQTGEIQIRIYNCSSDDNMEIQSNYNVLKIHNVI